MNVNMISRRSSGAWNNSPSGVRNDSSSGVWYSSLRNGGERRGTARRTLASWLTACVLAAFCAVPALAAPEDGVYAYILDSAGVLTEEQADALEERAAYVADTYDFAPYVVMVDGLSDVSAQDAALSFYDEYDMGVGENDAGSILLVNTENGDYGFYVMNTDGVDSETEASMEAAFLEAFDEGWYEGLAQYIQSFANHFSGTAGNADATNSAAPDGDLGGADGDYILDYAELLSESEENALEEKAGAMARTYGFAPCVLVEDSMDGYDAEDTAKSYYNGYEMGIGSDNNGSLLYMSMEDRDFWYLVEDHASKVFDEYRYDSVQQAFLKEFRNDDWYGGFMEYLNATEHYLSGAADAVDREAGEDWNYYGDYTADYGDDDSMFDTILGALIMFGIPIILALIISLVMLGQMSTVRHAAEAGSYLKDSLKLTVKEDIFTHTTETRVKVESDNDSSGGGSGGGGGGGSFSGGGKF